MQAITWYMLTGSWSQVYHWMRLEPSCSCQSLQRIQQSCGSVAIFPHVCYMAHGAHRCLQSLHVLVRVLYSHLGVRNVTCYGIRYVSVSLEEVAVCLTKEGSSGIRSSKYVQAWQSIEEQRLGLSLHQLVNIDITLCIVEWQTQHPPRHLLVSFPGQHGTGTGQGHPCHCWALADPSHAGSCWTLIDCRPLYDVTERKQPADIQYCLDSLYNGGICGLWWRAADFLEVGNGGHLPTSRLGTKNSKASLNEGDARALL